MAFIYSQNGPVSIHIKESLGGSSNPFNHYSTTYNLKYGKHWVNREMYREPQPGGNYMWSKRCHIGYSSSLDDFDNPFLKPIIMTNYLSVTKRDFVKPKLTHREYNLSNIHKPIVPAGYEFHTELTIPKSMHNPNDWTTTYKTLHNEKLPIPVDFHRDPIGKKELSGFSLNSPIIDTLSFRPHSTYKNDWPRTETNRPTGQTVYSTDYRKYSIPDGTEPLPEIPFGSDRSSGFVKGNQQRPDFIPPSQEVIKPKYYSPQELAKLKKTDPAEYLNNAYPYPQPSVTHGTFTDPFSQPPTEEEVLGRVKVGDKERTGFVANEINYVQTKDNPERFITHNMTKYYNPMLIGCEVNGHVAFNVLDIESDGFIKNNGISNFEKSSKMLDGCAPKMDNYQMRSFNKRDYVAK